MFGSLFILLILPIVDTSRIRSSQFRPLMKIFNWLFFVNFLILMWIGQLHPETPFIEIGQISTALYFCHFLIFVPIIGIAENTLMDVALPIKSINSSNNTISISNKVNLAV